MALRRWPTHSALLDEIINVSDRLGVLPTELGRNQFKREVICGDRALQVYGGWDELTEAAEARGRGRVGVGVGGAPQPALGEFQSEYQKKLEQIRQVAQPRYSPEPFYVGELPDKIDLPDLIERRKRQFERTRAAEDARKLIPIRLRDDLPIGILHFGDPHLDDDGTDIAAIEAHTKLCADTPGLFAANVGDTTNNWVGRLARLYGDQSTTAAEAWALATWFLGRCKWLYMLGGNHDLWSGAGDPLQWIARQHGTLYSPAEARLELQFPGGRKIRINARHDFAGSSIWNPAHGPSRAAQMGFDDHILVAGHRHVSGYSVVKNPSSGVVSHALRVASYKLYDAYARDRGLRQHHLSPCAVTVINPAASSEVSLVHVFWDPFEASEFLGWARNRSGRG